MGVIYDGKRLTPAPGQISFSKQYTRGEDGSLKKILFNVTVNGTMVVNMGSPKGDGTWNEASCYPPDDTIVVDEDPCGKYTTSDDRLALLRNKMGAMCKVFCVENSYKLFEIQPWDGSAATKFVPRIKSLSFESPDNYVNRVNYTIEMETDKITFGLIECCADDGELDENDCDESWQIEQGDDKGRTYRITHAVSATAFDEYDESGTGTLVRRGWQVAKEDKVVPKLGLDPTKQANSVVLDELETFSAYNYTRSEQSEERNGKYSVTETWTLYNEGSFFEEYTVNTRQDAETGATFVSIDGNIQGYEIRDNTTHVLVSGRWDTAQAGWATVEPLIESRILTLSGLSNVNTSRIGKTVGRNEKSGLITYNYEYTTNPCPTIAGARSESITIQDSFPVPVIAKHTVIARAIGPIFQNVGTITESRRTLTIDVQMATPSGCPGVYPTAPNVLALINANHPSTAYSIIDGPYLERNEASWSPSTGKYTRNVTWYWI